MSPTVRKGLLATAASLLAILLVVGLSRLTNSLDTTRFSWDFRYYIGMAQHPFAPPEASPFAYRYARPCWYGWSRTLPPFPWKEHSAPWLMRGQSCNC